MDSTPPDQPPNASTAATIQHNQAGKSVIKALTQFILNHLPIETVTSSFGTPLSTALIRASAIFENSICPTLNVKPRTYHVLDPVSWS